MTKKSAAEYMAMEFAQTILVLVNDKEETDKYDLELCDVILTTTITGNKYNSYLVTAVYSCLQYESLDVKKRDKLLKKYKVFFDHMNSKK